MHCNSSHSLIHSLARSLTSKKYQHAFYQVLNVFQVVFLHVNDSLLGRGLQQSLAAKCALLSLATCLWLVRHKVPVHSFSDNYNKIDPRSTSFVRLLYRLKKYQYVLYKHLLLHGLNISALLCREPIASSGAFRLYWALLNTSYGSEFFLQTLVKKRYMSQWLMLLLQILLMSAATLSVVGLLRVISPLASLLSLLLNFANRKRDFINTFVVFFIMCAIE